MKYLFAILVLLLVNNSINSQTVGLVLSGGGAKGLAHIGVIKALEENEIPIDYIAGTSMGAVVGALYSMGYTPSEMIEIFKSKEFHYWSTGEIDENQKFTANSKFDDASILSFEVRLDSSFLKPILPSHIVPTHQMDLAFLELFASGTALCNGNFDSLFVPFRCVASDIESKSQVLFKNGDLGENVRASMTIPIYFKPLIINGKMLFDGGIYNNFPWRELKECFKPEYIIGSKVANNTKPPVEDNILLQLENMIVGQTDYEIKDSSSILIQTNLKEVKILDFNRIDYIVNEGYQNTLKCIDKIRERTVRRVSQDSISMKRRLFVKKLPSLKFQSIYLSGINQKQKEFIKKTIMHKNEELTIKALNDNYYRLITDDFLKRLYPKAQYDNRTGLFDLYLRPDLKRNLEIGLGGNLSSSSINQGFISGAYNYLGTTANRVYSNIYFGRLYSSLDLSYRIMFPWRKPLVIESSIILSRLDYYRSSGELFFEDVKPSYLIKNEGFANLGVSLPISKSLSISNDISMGGLDNEYYQTDIYTHNDIPDKTYFKFWNNSFKVEKKTLNRKQYSYRGRKQFFKINFISGKEKHLPGTTSNDSLKSVKYHTWINIKLYNESYHRIITNRIWLGLFLDANYSNMRFFSNSKANMLIMPAFNPTPHSKTVFIKNLRSDKYIALGLIPNIRLFRQIYFRGEAYAYQPFIEILDQGEPKEITSTLLKSIRALGSLSIIAQTRVGPFSFSVNYYPKESKEFYLVFNYGYILFNRKGLE
jgi:NTE family protein